MIVLMDLNMGSRRPAEDLTVELVEGHLTDEQAIQYLAEQEHKEQVDNGADDGDPPMPVEDLVSLYKDFTEYSYSVSHREVAW